MHMTMNNCVITEVGPDYGDIGHGLVEIAPNLALGRVDFLRVEPCLSLDRPVRTGSHIVQSLPRSQTALTDSSDLLMRLVSILSS